MKSLDLVVLLAAAATAAVVSNKEPDVVMAPDVAEDPELTAVATRNNLNLGQVGSSMRIFNRVYRANGVAGQTLVWNIPVRSPGRRITAIRVNRIGASQNARATIASGGIGNNHVTIRLISARGRGYHYRVEVYTR